MSSQQEEDETPLLAAVRAGPPYFVGVIQYIDEFNPEQLTKKVIFTALWYRDPAAGDRIVPRAGGVLTYLVEKYKSNLLLRSNDNNDDDDNESESWTEFIDWVKERASHERVQITMKSGDELREYMEVFPELICWKFLDNNLLWSPMELCFGRSDFSSEEILYFANKNVEDPPEENFYLSTPSSSSYEVPPNQQRRVHELMGPILDERCVDALDVILSRGVKTFLCDYHKWTPESFSKLIQILLCRAQTVREVSFDFAGEFWLRPSNDDNPTGLVDPGFSDSIKQLLDSLDEGQQYLSCSIETCSIRIVAVRDGQTCPILFMLPYMHHLKVLELHLEDKSMIGWHHIQEVLAQGRLESLEINLLRSYPTDPILPILEATRNSRSLTKVCMITNIDTAHVTAIQDYMLDIFQGNTTLTDVDIYTEDHQEDAKRRKKIRFLSFLNQCGRGEIQQSNATVLDMINVLVNVRWLDPLSDFFGETRYDTGIISILYGLLRERPLLWVPNITTNATPTVKEGKRKRDMTT